MNTHSFYDLLDACQADYGLSPTIDMSTFFGYFSCANGI
jgi:hypothetical protein